MSDRGRSPSSTGSPGGSPSPRRLNDRAETTESKTNSKSTKVGKKGPPPRHVHKTKENDAETSPRRSPKSTRGKREASPPRGEGRVVGSVGGGGTSTSVAPPLLTIPWEQQRVGVAIACQSEAAELFTEPKESTDRNCNKMNESRTSQISDSGVESMESEKLRTKVAEEPGDDQMVEAAKMDSLETEHEKDHQDGNLVDLSTNNMANQSIKRDVSNGQSTEESSCKSAGVEEELNYENDDDSNSPIDEPLEAKFDLLPCASGKEFLGVLGYRRIDLIEDEKDVMASSIICTDGSDVEALSDVDDNDNGLDGNDNEKDSSDSIELLGAENDCKLKYADSSDPLCPGSDTDLSNLEALRHDFSQLQRSSDQHDPDDLLDRLPGSLSMPCSAVLDVAKLEAGLSSLKPPSSQVSENDSDSHFDDDSDTSDGGGGAGIGGEYLNYEDVMSSLIYGYTAMTDSGMDQLEAGTIHRPDSLCLPRRQRRLARSESNSSSVHSYSSTEALIEAATSTPLHAQGTVDQEGDMIAFVAQDLAEKIRMSSPLSLTRSSRGDSSGASYAGGSQTPSGRSVSSINSMSSSTSGWSTSSASGWSAISTSGMSRSPSLLTQSPEDIPPIDPRVILDLETHAHHVADNLDHMMRNLKFSLHKMSSLTVNCVGTYKCAIDKTCDSVDGAIKSMYALMAKCEELSKTMKPIYHVADQIKEIKRLLDLFEAQISREDK